MENGLDTKAGIKELLVWLGENGYKRAVATATDLTRAGKYLQDVGLYEYFDTIADAAKVKRSKPDPEIFLKAAMSLPAIRS